MVSFYYVHNEIKQFIWRIKRLSPRISWRSRWQENLILGAYVLARFDLILMGFCLVLAMVAVTLLAFLLQQMWFVSVNKTQVELEKIDAVKKRWQKEGVVRKYVHAYGHGFVQNWKEVLFPVDVRKDAPRDYTAEWEAQEKKVKVNETPVEARRTKMAKKRR
jgi:uncharacterized protein (DUF58 family)